MLAQVAAGAVFTDDDQRILFVEPTYQREWNLPGGSILEFESPLEGCRREVLEEIGLDIAPGPLLAVDFKRPAYGKPGRFRLLYDCGTLSQQEVASISLRGDELKSFRFMTLEESERFLVPVVFSRLSHSLPLLGSGRGIYLEEGQPPNWSF